MLSRLITAVATDDAEAAVTCVDAASEVDEGVLVAAGSADGSTCLGIAAKRGSVVVVRALLEASNVDCNVARRTTTPLMVAAAHGHLDVVLALLADGRVDVNRKRRDGVTALLLAVQANWIDCARALLRERRTKPSIRSLFPQRLTPLILAIRLQRLDAVAVLLQSDRLDFEDNVYMRQSPLEYAADAFPPAGAMLSAFERGGCAAVRAHLVAEGLAELLLVQECEADAAATDAAPPPRHDAFAPELRLLDEIAALGCPPAASALLDAVRARLRARSDCGVAAGAAAATGAGAGAAAAGATAAGGAAATSAATGGALAATELPTALRVVALDTAGRGTLSGTCWDLQAVHFSVNGSAVAASAAQTLCSGSAPCDGYAARLATCGDVGAAPREDGETGNWGGRADAGGCFWIGLEVRDAVAARALRALRNAPPGGGHYDASVGATLVQDGGAHSADAVALELRCGESGSAEWVRLRTYRVVRARGMPNALLHGRGALPPSATASAGAPQSPTSFAGLRGRGILRDGDNPATTYFVVVGDASVDAAAPDATVADATVADATVAGVAGRAAEGAPHCTVFVPVASDGAAAQWERRARGRPDRTFFEVSRDDGGVVLCCDGEEAVRLERDALVRARDGTHIAAGAWHDGPATQGTPWHLADVVWRFAPSALPLDSFSVDVTVHAAPPGGAQTPPLYIAPAFARIGVSEPASSAGVDGRLRYLRGGSGAPREDSAAVPFYGGLQTHAGGFAPCEKEWRQLGSAAIFSRWNVRSPDALRTAGDSAGLRSAWESGGYEGPFVSVRRQLACPVRAAPRGEGTAWVPTTYRCTWTVRHAAVADRSPAASSVGAGAGGAEGTAVLLQTWIDMHVAAWPLCSPPLDPPTGELLRALSQDIGGLLFAEQRARVPAALLRARGEGALADVASAAGERAGERPAAAAAAALRRLAPTLHLGDTLEAFVEVYGDAASTTATPATLCTLGNLRINGAVAAMRSTTVYRGDGVPANARAMRPAGPDASALRVATSPFPFGPSGASRAELQSAGDGWA